MNTEHSNDRTFEVNNEYSNKEVKTYVIPEKLILQFYPGSKLFNDKPLSP